MRRSRKAWALVSTLAVVCACAVALVPSKYDSLLHQNRVFEFRERRVGYEGSIPVLPRHAGLYLPRLAAGGARTAGGCEVHPLVVAPGIRGRSTDARAQFDALGWHNLLWNRALFVIRGRHGDLTVDRRAYSRIPFAAADNEMFIPVSMNGQPANYAIDTGASDWD